MDNTEKIISTFYKKDFLVVDVGARNGMRLLPNWYSKKSDLIGFEPHENELQKLKMRKTSAILKWGDKHKFKSELYLGQAVWNSDGYVKFHEAEWAGRSAVELKFNKITNKIFYNNENFKNSGETLKVNKLKSIKLDTYFKEKLIDFLKIDVEGGEIKVLEGSSNKLDNKEILFIQTEFMVNDYYENSSLIDQQIKYLKLKGYRLINILPVDDIRYSRSKNNYFKINKNFLLFGDLHFILDPDKNSLNHEKKARLALILLAMGYKQNAVEILEETNYFKDNKEIKLLINEFNKVPLRKKILGIYNRFPFLIYNLFRKFLKI